MKGELDEVRHHGPANARSQAGVRLDDELVEAVPQFGEAFALARVLVTAEEPRLSP